MGKVKAMLKTRCLRIMPVSDEELGEWIEKEADADLKQAYLEMLAGSKEHPEARDWYTAWKFCLKNGEVIGDGCFKGPPQDGEVEIGYGIAQAHQGKGYATEATKALADWAFSQTNVYFITAETDPSNTRSQRVLEKNGFLPDGEGHEGPRFVKAKPPSGWIAVYLMIGTGIGVSFGSSLGNMTLALPLGISFGLLFGAMLDAQEKSRFNQMEADRLARRATESKP